MVVTVPLVAIVCATIKIVSVIVQTHLQMSALAYSIGGYIADTAVHSLLRERSGYMRGCSCSFRSVGLL